MMRTRLLIAVLALALVNLPLFGDWFDDYEAGVKAAKAGKWSTVIEKMNASIRVKSQENPRERAYGNIFINYRPYYYRGIAYYELQQWQRAIEDLERTEGPGAANLGSKDSKIMNARRQLEGAATPTPTREIPPPTPGPTRTATPRPPPITPAPGTPTPIPVGDTTSVREARVRAQKSLNQAQNQRTAAVQQRANTLARAEFARGMSELNRAQTLNESANSAAEWNAVGSAAEGARANFEEAIARSSGPVDDILAATRRRVRTAVEDYFDGRYDQAAREFGALARQQNNNALLWAFYGAAVYSSYYIDGQRNAAERSEAESAFRRARALRLRELPSNYFSPRIRRFYSSVR